MFSFKLVGTFSQYYSSSSSCNSFLFLKCHIFGTKFVSIEINSKQPFLFRKRIQFLPEFCAHESGNRLRREMTSAQARVQNALATILVMRKVTIHLFLLNLIELIIR